MLWHQKSTGSRLVKHTTLYKEWMHTLKKEDISLTTEIDKPEILLLYTDELLKIFGINLKDPSKDSDNHGYSNDE